MARLISPISIALFDAIEPWLSHGIIQPLCMGFLYRHVENVLVSEPFTLENFTFTQSTIYIRMPFINEDFKRRALGVVRRSGIANIKIYFENGRPLAKVFAPPRNKPNCTDKCVTCKLASKRNQCLTKNVVYQITCTTCDIIYIGETGRTKAKELKNT